MTADVAFLAEANQSIGTGHLVEALHLARAAEGSGLRSIVIVPRATPRRLLESHPFPVWPIESLDPQDLNRWAAQACASGVRAAVIDFRSVTNLQLTGLAAGGVKTYCIDELGGRTLECEAVFNPTIMEDRHHYGPADSARLFKGPSYFPLAAEYARYHRQPRSFMGALGSVTISMGGVDRSGATLRVFAALDAWPTNADRHVVLGGSFAWEQEFEELLSTSRSRWQVHRNPSGLAELLAASDVAITAGGNTLYELACVGTPAIVLHEDAHEGEQGSAFESRGFGRAIGSGVSFEAGKLRAALMEFDNAEVREAHSLAGRAIVDGLGAARICDIVVRDLARSLMSEGLSHDAS